MKSPLPFRVIPCDEWGAKPPAGVIAATGKPERGIFHHTAGHVPQLGAGETYAEACAYARAVQNFHMKGNGWNDSGHNFLVTRGGFILEGRHGSLAHCRAGNMVVSAHCPNQNTNPGVEHEHQGAERMTPIQYEAAVWLWARLCRWGGFKPLKIEPHNKYFSTSCPGTLAAILPRLRESVAKELTPPKNNDEAWWGEYIGPMSKADQKRAFALLREAQKRYAK